MAPAEELGLRPALSWQPVHCCAIKRRDGSAGRLAGCVQAGEVVRLCLGRSPCCDPNWPGPPSCRLAGFVFTDELLVLRGNDADLADGEEALDPELQFSDDEAVRGGGGLAWA